MNSDVKFVNLSCAPTPASPQSEFFTPTSVSPQRAKTKQQYVANKRVARSILRAKKPRKSRIVFNFTAEEMAPYYHLPQREAAKLLGVAVITIKRTCKRRGIRWPYRDAKLKQVQGARANAALRRAQQPGLRVSGMALLSDAAVAFARLPFACMEENANAWDLQLKRTGSMKEPPLNLTYRCVKTSLKSVVKNNLVMDKLGAPALRANGTVIHTLQLLKLYLLHCCEKGDELPKLDRPFVTSVMQVLCKPPSKPPSAETQIIKDTLKPFYEQHYKAYVSEELSYEHMSTVLDYLSTDVITMYENNTKQNYVEYVEWYINVSWSKKELVAIARKRWRNTRSRQDALCARLRRVKDDLLRPHQPKTPHPLYHAWIDEQRHLVLPARDLQKENVHYDIQCSPQDYLPCMLRMMKAAEAHGTSVKDACPLRSNVVPKHVRTDTTSLVYLCFTEEQGKKMDYTKNGNLRDRQDTTWGFFFKTNTKCFRAKGYTFDHQIETDGVGCSILLKRKALPGERVIQAKNGNSETYIEEVADYEPLKGKTIVAIDPNMSDLLYCVDGDAKEQTRFRYTQDTRRKETKAKKYRDYIQQRKQEVIDGKRVDEREAELSAYNRKTTDFERFKAYVKKKNEVNRRLSLVYNQYIFRKLKLGGYMRRQITEARLLKRFEKLFGSGADTIVAIGDWSQRQHRRFNEPVKGKGFRTMFRKAGYDVYLVDEFRTSSRCSACEQGECKTFRVCENPRPYRSGNTFAICTHVNVNSVLMYRRPTLTLGSEKFSNNPQHTTTRARNRF